MKNNLSPQLGKYLETGNPDSLLEMRYQLKRADADVKADFKNLLAESDNILYGDGGEEGTTKPAQELDQPKKDTIFKGDVSDLTDDKKIGADEAKAFFQGSDKKPDATKADVVDSNADIVDDNPQAVAPEMADITIDKTEVREPKKPGKQFSIKSFLNQNIGEKPKPEVKEENTETEFQLMVDLRNEIDRYNQLFARSNKLEKDIEQRATQKELAKLEVVDTIRSAIFSTDYRTNVGRSRLAHLADTLEDEIARKEAGELNTDIVELESAKDAIMDKLDILLRLITDDRKIDKLRDNLEDLILDTEMNRTEPENFKADIASMFDNRIAEIRRSKNPEKIINQIDEIGVTHETAQPKTKIDDAISIGSAGLAEQEAEAEQATDESANQASLPADGSLASDKEKDKPKEAEAPKGESEVSDLFDSKPTDDAPKKADTNIYKKIADESATAAAEGLDVIEDAASLPGKASAGAGTPASEGMRGKESSNVVAPPVPAEPLVKTDAINEFVDINDKGIPVSVDSVKHKEVGLNAKEGLSAEQLADLTGKRDENVKGIVNLKSSDLIKKVELPRHSDKRVKIQERLAELRNQPQAEVDSDIFGKDSDPVTDITGRSLNEAAVTTETPPKEDMSAPSATIPEPEIEDAASAKDEAVAPTPQDGSIGGDSEGMQGKKVEIEEIPLPEVIKAEAEAPKGDKLDTDITADKGPDLVAEAPKEIKKAEIAQPVPAIETPTLPKKAGLWKDFTKLIGLGKDSSFTTDKIHDAETDIMNTRNI